MTTTEPTTNDIDPRRVAALTIGLALDCRRFGDRRQGDMSSVEVDADKGLLNLSKHLVPRRSRGAGASFPQAALDAAKALRAIERVDDAAQADLKAAGLPSFFKPGTYRIPLGLLDEIDAKLAARVKEREPRIAEFCRLYPALIDAMAAPLGKQFRRDDYPDVDTVRQRFSFEWRWFELDAIPDQVRAASPVAFRLARKRLEESMRDVAIGVRSALREDAADAVRDIAGKLADAGAEKPRAFRQATILDDLSEFFRTFPLRNVTDDDELTTWVDELRKKVDGLNLADVKADVGRQAALKADLNGLLKRAPRVIELD